MIWTALDTETTGLNPWKDDRPFAYSFCNSEGLTKYFRGHVDPFTRDVSKPKGSFWIRKILANPSIDKVFHNAPFDIHMLESMGFEINGKIWDTMILTHVNDSSQKLALKPLCKKLLSIEDTDEKDLHKSTLAGRRKGKKLGWKLAESVKADYWMADPLLCMRYAVMDAVRTAKLFQYWMEKYNSDEIYRELVDMEHQTLEVSIQMERNGVVIDRKRAFELEDYYLKIVKQADKEKKSLGYENLNTKSPVQMRKVFYEDLGLTPEYKNSKGKDGRRKRTLTCDALRLQRWASQGVDLAATIVKMNTAKTQLNTFIRPLLDISDRDSIVHPNFNVVGPITGRLSCRNPNLQNISNQGASRFTDEVDLKVRELFVPRPEHIFYMPDFSQVEVWIAAFTSDDEIMKQALNEGHDMHADFSEQHFSTRKDWEEKKDKYRKRTKNGTFCTFYGGGTSQLADTLQLDFDETEEWKAAFWDRYTGLMEFTQALSKSAEQLGYIEDPFGRQYKVDRNTSYKAFNYLIQGSAAGIMKRALISVSNLISEFPGVRMLLTIHDEIILEVPLKYHSKKLMRLIVKAMQGNLHEYFEIPKPFPVSVAYSTKRWSIKKEVNLE